MATYWVSTLGSDSNGGTSYSDAKLTLGAGLALLATKGDILNVVADGTHTWPTTRTDVSNLTGTSYSDPGCIVRGTNSSGDPALATIAPAASGVHRFVQWRGTTKYTITENLIFDATSQVADPLDYTAVEWRDATQGPHKIRYCAMLGGASGSFAAGNRYLHTVNTSGASVDQGQAEYCYYQNIDGNGPTFGRQFRYQHCLYINDSGSARASLIFPYGALVASQADRVIQVTNCTIYESTTGLTQEVINFAPSSGINAGTENIYSNLVWINTTGTLNPFVGGSAASTSVTHAGTINGNVLLGGPDVSAGDLGSAGWYELPWDANDDDTTDPDTWPGDTVAYGVADTAIFNDPASTFNWELPNGLQLTILKDLRPIQYTTSGLFGDTPGALSVIGVSDPQDDDDPAAIPFIDVRPFYAPVLRLEANVRLSTIRNRLREHYLRNDVEDQSWRESALRRIVLASGASHRVRSGIETGSYLMVESDVAVRVNAGVTEDIYLPAAKQIVALGGSYDILKLKNESADTATSIAVMVD